MSPSKEQLIDWYLSKRLSTWAIEKNYGYSRSLIYRRLHEYKIPIRSLAASHFKTPRKDFSGTLEEKAYLIGFSAGDLRVRLHNKKGRSETISVACSSSKPAQIKVIRGLFSGYGHIWEGKANYRKVVSIETFVNLSFDFLFKKNLKNNLRSFKKRNQFLAFLAGFSDAEGSIFITNGAARMSWGNYDFETLNYIKRELVKMGIKTSSVNCDYLKGCVGKEGYKRKENYYHLCCAEKSSLEKLFNLIRTFVRHGDKMSMLDLALQNIKERNKKFPWTIKKKVNSI